MLTFDVPTGWSAVALIILAGVVLAADLPATTVALLSGTTTNPANVVQANSVRLASEGGGSPAFTIPALMPGESVDRAIGIRSTGSGDARLDLAVVPEDAGPLITDLASGLSLTVDRCRNGVWATTTPVAGVPTPPADGAKLACAVTPGAKPSVETVYQGPIVPRGAPAAGDATPTPQAIQLVDRLIAGDRADFRVRVAVPAMPPDATVPPARQGAVSFEWRATGLGSNLAGTPLIGAPPPPVVATATATPVVSATATAIPTATATGTALPTATATASPTATLSPYGGTALAFDGMVDAMQVGWTQAIGPLSGRTTWTFEAWVNPADLSVARVIYSEAAANGDALAIRLAPEGSGATRLEVGLRHGGAIDWSGATVASGTMAVGTWTNVAAAFEAGTRLDLAVNGATIASLATAGATTVPDVVPVTSRVARAGDAANGAPFAGVIDEVRAWSYARTYDGVDTTYAQKLLGIEDGLILHYPMGVYAANGSDAKGLTLVDQSPSKVVGTLSGGVRWVTSRVPVDRPATPLGLQLATGSDTGQSASDRITRLSSVTIEGSVGGDDTVSLSIDGGATIATTVLASNGKFTATIPVAGGDISVVARATDVRGRTSTWSSPLSFTVKTTGARVTSILRNPLVPGSPPSFTVNFDESVWGVTQASFVPKTGVGLLGTPKIQSVTGSGTTYVVALNVSGVSGNLATVGVQLGSTGATDVAGNAPAGVAAGVVPETFVIRQRQVVTDTSWQSPNGSVADYAWRQGGWGGLLGDYPAGTMIIWAGGDCEYCDRTFSKVLPNAGLITSLTIDLTLDDYHWVYVNNTYTGKLGTTWNIIYTHNLTSNAYLGGPGTMVRVDGHNYGGPAGFMASVAVASVEVP
jgi:hypothetical protein